MKWPSNQMCVPNMSNLAIGKRNTCGVKCVSNVRLNYCCLCGQATTQLIQSTEVSRNTVTLQQFILDSYSLFSKWIYRFLSIMCDTNNNRSIRAKVIKNSMRAIKSPCKREREREMKLLPVTPSVGPSTQHLHICENIVKVELRL